MSSGDRGRERRVAAPTLAAALATLVCVVGYGADRAGLIALPWIDAVELDSIDARFRLRGARAPVSDDIIIVGLDEETRRRAPDVLQTRAGWARLIAALDEYDPAAIGIDALFAAPEVNLPAEVVARVREARVALAAEVEPTAASRQAADALAAVLAALSGDRALAEAIAGAGNVQLGVVFALEGGGRAPAPGAVGAAAFDDAAVVATSPAPPTATGAAHTLPAIAAGAAGAGHLNVGADADGVLRRVPLAIAHAGTYYAPLPLTMLRAAHGGALAYATGDDAVAFGRTALPVDARGYALLDFLGPRDTFPTVSAADVLDGDVPRDALRGKLVFVGLTGAIQDMQRTPFDPLFPGVEAHATLAHNALHGELLRPAGAWVTLAILALLGGLLTAAQARRVRGRRTWVTGVLAALLIAGYWALAQLLFANGVVVEVVAPTLTCVVVALGAMTATLATEGREKLALRRAFSQYVENGLVEQILDDPTRVRLGGERRELTVLFSDIRGFSRFSEGLEPEALSSLLNEYLTPMTELVLRHRGMLDKYIGDAVMAVYGAPLHYDDHTLNACRTALAMRAALVPLNDRFRERSLPAIEIGIGINTGPMAVGNMGSESRFDYTVLGDAVNLASRLEALTKEYGAHILAGERTAEIACGTFAFRELDFVRVTGRAGTARIFELLGTHDDTPIAPEDVGLFERGLGAYRRAEWDEARDAFVQFLRRHPHDKPAQTLLERIGRLRDIAAADWDGVYDQRSK